MHLLFAAAPPLDTLAPHLSNLQVEVTTLELAFSLLPFVVVGVGYLLDNLLGHDKLEETFDHDLLLAQLYVQINVGGAQLTETFPLGLIEKMRVPDPIQVLLSQLLNKLQILEVTLGQYGALERLLEVLQLVYLGRELYVLLDVINLVNLCAQSLHLLLLSEFEVSVRFFAQLTCLAAVIDLLNDWLDQLGACTRLRGVFGHAMDQQFGGVEVFERQTGRVVYHGQRVVVVFSQLNH